MYDKYKRAWDAAISKFKELCEIKDFHGLQFKTRHMVSLEYVLEYMDECLKNNSGTPISESEDCISRANTIDEVLRKIKEYERQQKEKEEKEIKVGDEIYCHGTRNKKVVLKIYEYADGKAYVCFNNERGISTEREKTRKIEKTGRHFDEVSTLIDGIDTLEQEFCEDAISRQYLVEKATKWDKHFTDSERFVSLTDIQNAPPVTPTEKVGRWIEWNEHCRCSECKFKLDAYVSYFMKYCPNCGAKMQGGDAE